MQFLNFNFSSLLCLIGVIVEIDWGYYLKHNDCTSYLLFSFLIWQSMLKPSVLTRHIWDLTFWLNLMLGIFILCGINWLGMASHLIWSHYCIIVLLENSIVHTALVLQDMPYKMQRKTMYLEWAFFLPDTWNEFSLKKLGEKKYEMLRKWNTSIEIKFSNVIITVFVKLTWKKNIYRLST